MEKSLVTLKDTAKEVNLNEKILEKILTPDCAITIKGIYYPIEFRYESYELSDQLKKLQSVGEEGGKMNRSETISMLTNLASNRQVAKYIFDEYTIPIGDEKTNNEESEKLYRIDIDKISGCSCFKNFQRTIKEKGSGS